MTDAGRTSRCRECGRELGAGYLCDDCDVVEAVPTAEALEEVVTVGRSSATKKYHIPDDDGKPLCGQRAKRRQVDNRPDYNVKDPVVLPNHSLCKFCEDRLGGESVDKGGTLGPNLATTLEGMDA